MNIFREKGQKMSEKGEGALKEQEVVVPKGTKEVFCESRDLFLSPPKFLPCFVIF